MRRRFFFIPLFGIAFAALASAAVMLLWNALLPPILNVGAISYWQALGLLVLSRLLFGGMHGWHHRHHPHLPRHHWLKLSPEERDHLRARWHCHCGCDDTPPAQSPPTP